VKKYKICDGCNKRTDPRLLRRAGVHGMYCPECKENRVGYTLYHKARNVV